VKRSTLTRTAGAAALLVALASAFIYETQPDAPDGILAGSGQVRGTEVTISARVGGTAETIPAREGERVRRGDLLAKIDAGETDARLRQARAQAEAISAKRRELEAQLDAITVFIDQARMAARMSRESTEHEIHGARVALARAQAEVFAAEAEAGQAARLDARYANLASQAFVSKTYYDGVQSQARIAGARRRAARLAREQAAAALDRAQAATDAVRIKEADPIRLAAEYQRVEASLITLGHTEEAARARVAEVEAVLADTRLAAPIDGTVMSRLAEPGELVPAGRPVVVLVDLGALYVRAYVSERDIARVRLGNPARVYADAFPGRSFAGNVVEIAERPEFTPKDAHVKDEREKLVFGVKVALHNPRGYLKPGMPVDFEIKWKEGARWPQMR